MIERVRPRITEFVDELLDAAAEAGTIDVISELGRPLPVTVIAEMLGVPAEDQGTFRGWSEALAHTVDPDMDAEASAGAAAAGSSSWATSLPWPRSAASIPRTTC